MALDPAASEGQHPLLAYIYQRAGTPSATSILLREYVQAFADRENLFLDEVFVGVEGQTEVLAVRDLIRRAGLLAGVTVVVAGPAHQVLQALKRIPDVRILTLSDISNRGQQQV